MSMDIVSRLRCVLKGDKTAQAGADEIERLRAELAASRERFDKASAAFEREQDRALAAEVRAESAETALAASREREARMWDAIDAAANIIGDAPWWCDIWAARDKGAQG